MDVERTMEFILEQQARNQSMLAEMITENRERGVVIDRRLDRLERTVTRLARLGVKSRSKINGRLDDHDRWFAEQKLLMHEMGEKLNAMINYVDRLPGTPPQS
jgi:predicted transcriptional regulator